MKHIIVDLEMNRLAKQFRSKFEICGMEIIEIGAVVLDENYQEIGCFKTLVKPQYNPVIERRYEKLTGISTKMVENAPVFEEALQMFLNWCESLNDELIIYQWSEADMLQLHREMNLKSICLDGEEKQLLFSWKDLQKEFAKNLNLKKQVALKEAVMLAGIDFEGKLHDALFDARNTGALLRVLEIPELYQKTLAIVAEAIEPKACSYSLGSMFDFSQFNIMVS